MQSILYLLKILFYFILIYFIIIYSKSIYKRNNKGNLFSILAIIIFSLLFGVYSANVSVKPFESDRSYYVSAYGTTYRDYQLPKGYLILTKALSKISLNPDFLFFMISLIVMAITLYLYRKSEIANPYGLELLLLSLYFIYGFHIVKQSLAIAFGTISIMFFLNKNYVRSFLWWIISVLFHESALLLLPIYILLIGSKRKTVRVAEYILAIGIIFSFSGISIFFSKEVFSLFPSFAIELKDYFDDLRITTNGIITSIKGIPLYLITYLLLKKRKELSNTYKNYDKYIILSLFVSITYLLSAYMYWMYRFGLLGMFFVFMIFGKIYETLTNKNEKLFYYLGVYCVMFILTVRYLIQMFFLYGGF